MKTISPLLLVLLFLSNIQAQTNEALIKKVMKVTGTESSLSKIQSDLTTDINELSKEATEDELKLIKDEIQSVFRLDSLEQRYIRHYLTVFDKNMVNQLLHVYENPLFQKITDMESRDAGDEEISGFIANFKEEDYSKERIELINRIKTAGRVSDFTYYAMRFSIKVAVTISTSLAGSAASEKPDELVDMIMKQSEPEMDKFVTISMFMAYKDLSDDELEEYTEFYESDLGKWQTEATITSYLTALTESADLFASTFPAKIKSKKT